MIADSEGELAVQISYHAAECEGPPACQWEMAAYPHPGCAEFGEPDVMACSNRANVLLRWRETFVPEPPHEPYDDQIRLCAQHVAETTDIGGEPSMWPTMIDMTCLVCDEVVGACSCPNRFARDLAVIMEAAQS